MERAEEGKGLEPEHEPEYPAAESIGRCLRPAPSHVFVLSMPKCGTTSLHIYLQEAGFRCWIAREREVLRH
eukprot:5854887-Amphidinium_carterae.1